MRLFHAVTVYQLLSCIAFCIDQKFDPQDNVLLLSAWMESRINNKKELKKYFSEILYYEGVSLEKSDTDLVNKVDRCINNFLKVNHLKIEQFNRIYVGGVQYYFGIYLALHNINFVLFEESCGIISNPQKLFDIDHVIDKERSEKAAELNLYSGENENIDTIYCNLTYQSEDYCSEKAKDFRLFDILSESSESDKESILKIFGTKDRIDASDYDILLLTQQFSNLKILTFQEQILIYKLLFDFYLPNDKVLIKAHPDDLCFYESLFSHTKKIKDLFPSELLPLVLDNKPETIATISSTGINSLETSFKNSIKLGFEYEKSYLNTIRIYCSLKLAKILNIKELRIINGNIPSYTEMAKNKRMDLFGLNISEFNDGEELHEGLVIVDRYEHSFDCLNLERILESNSLLLLNSDENYGFYRFKDKRIFLNALPVVIKKKVFNNECNYLPEDDETIYFLSRSEQNMKKIKEAKIDKKLENTGVEISLSKLSDEQLEIKRLEGILEATEKRLAYYVKKADESEKE